MLLLSPQVLRHALRGASASALPSLRHIHATSVLLKRKTGASAEKEQFRAPSKAQKARRRKERERSLQRLKSSPEKLALRRAKRETLLAKTSQPLSPAYEAKLDNFIASVMLPEPSHQPSGITQMKDTPNRPLLVDGSAHLYNKSATPSLEARKHAGLQPEYDARIVMAASCARKGNPQGILDIIQSAHSTDPSVPPPRELFLLALKAARKARKASMSDSIFKKMIDVGWEPDVDAWVAFIECKARGGDLDGAISEANRLKALGVVLTDRAYNSLISGMLEENRDKEANDMFLQMKEDGVIASKHTYTTMTVWCTKTANPERALFLLDEMAVMDVKPDEKFFVGLLKACTTAPHHRQECHDYIHEAMNKIEAYEIAPSVSVYNAVIHAFSIAADASAAVFFFKEMLDKQLDPNVITYTSLFAALARENSVGGKFGFKGLWQRPPPQELTRSQKIIARAGPAKFAEVASLGEYLMDDNPNVDKGTGLKEHEIAEILEDDRLNLLRRNSASRKLSIEQHVAALSGKKMGESAYLDDSDDLLAALRQYEGVSNDEDFALADEEDEEVVEARDEFDRLIAELGQNGDGEEEEMSRRWVVRTPKTVRKSPSAAAIPARGKGDDVSRLMMLGEMMDTYTPDRVVLQDTSRSDADRNNSSSRCEKLLSEPLQNWASKGSPSALISVQKKDYVQHAETEIGLGLELESTLSIRPEPVSHVGRITATAAFARASEYLDHISFGTPTHSDYSEPYKLRHDRNINAAEELLRELHARGLQPTIECMTSFMSVYAEALRIPDALHVLEQLPALNLHPDAKTYRTLIRMYVRAGDMAKALKVKESMIEKGITPDKQSYGLLVNGHASRGQLLEGLKLLEEMDAKGITLPMRFSYVIRGRCKKLGLEHALIPEHPRGFLVEGHAIRKQGIKNGSQRAFQQVRSQTKG